MAQCRFVLRWRLELGNRLDPGLRFLEGLAPGNRVGPGGGLVLGVRAAPGGPLLSERGDHGGDGPVFEVGWRLDVRRKLLDDLADLAVLVHDGLAVAAAGEMAVEFGAPG